MEKFTIDYLRENGLIAYEYVRGSTLYHLSLTWILAEYLLHPMRTS